MLRLRHAGSSPGADPLGLAVVSSSASGETFDSSPPAPEPVYRDESYLDGPNGPYQGQVLDAETREPLVGAVMVASWSRPRIWPWQTRPLTYYAVRETVTGPDGRFFLDANEVEQKAPWFTRKPEFLVFCRPRALVKPG